MDEKLLKHVATYYPIYQYVGSCTRSLEDIREYLISLGIHRNTVKSQLESITGDNPGMFRINGDLVTIDTEKAISFIADLESCFSSVLNAEDTAVKMVVNLQEEYAKLKAEKCALESKLEALNKKKEKTTAISKKKLEACKLIFPKLLEVDSVAVGEIENVEDSIFLNKEVPLLSYEEFVRRHGLERDSFYMELGEECELSQENYRKKTFRTIFTESRFLKRLQETTRVQEKSKNLSLREEIAKKFHVSDDVAAMQERFVGGRAVSIQEILSDKKLSNQEKLSLYAFYSPYRRTDMERLLNMAGDQCVNAEWLIMLLETPELCNNYENVKNLLRQSLKPSEWEMKQRLAEELIARKWYIKAKYNGKETKFQLVPIEEFNEIRERLELPPSEFTSGREKESVEAAPVKKEAPKKNTKKTEKKPIVKPSGIPTAKETDEDGIPTEITNYGE